MKSTFITNQLILVRAYGAKFFVNFPDIFEKYRVRATSDKMVHDWFHNPIQFWQHQLNFAIWCATTRCGVSLYAPGFELNKSVLSFHVYYQIRRILKKISAPLPQDRAWNSTNNPYNRFVYERICQIFNISMSKDWRIKGLNHGLGILYSGQKLLNKKVMI